MSGNGLSVRRLVVATGDRVLVESVDLVAEPGGFTGIVGGSGSGKSLTCLAIAGLLPPGTRLAAGRAMLDGESIPHDQAAELRRWLGARIGLVFQDPYASLNPVRRVGSLVAEVVSRHRGTGRADAWAIARRALLDVGLPDRAAEAYPHELSGGQRQRAAIALAIVNRPRLLIADEPTTALDPTVQLRILDLLAERARSAAALFVTHDLGAAARLCRRIAVMYAGRIVENAPTRGLVAAPAHPYTAALLATVPRLDGSARPRPIPGAPPSPDDRGPGCSFAPRCPRRSSACERAPPLRALGAGRLVACHHPVAEAA